MITITLVIIMNIMTTDQILNYYNFFLITFTVNVLKVVIITITLIVIANIVITNPESNYYHFL